MNDRSVVSRIKSPAIPSTPSEYFTPRDGIQSNDSRKMKSPDVLNPSANQSGSERAKVAPANKVDVIWITRLFSFGRKAMTTAPTSGRKIRSERSPIIPRPLREEDVNANEAEDAGRHRQCVTLGLAVLKPPVPAPRRLENVRYAVDGAVDEDPVEPGGDFRRADRQIAGPVDRPVDHASVDLPQETPA